jgi:hypothetical protein
VRSEILWDCCWREVVVRRRPGVRGERGGETETKMLQGVCVCVCGRLGSLPLKKVETEMPGIKGRKELMNTKTTKRVWKRRGRRRL